MRKGLTPLLIPLLSLPGCALFAPTPPIVAAHPVGCTSLIPPSWWKETPNADLPENHIADWLVYSDKETTQKEIADERRIEGFGIVKRCEERDAEAVKRATRKGIFHRIFGENERWYNPGHLGAVQG